MKTTNINKQLKFYNNNVSREIRCPICGNLVDGWDEICEICKWEVDGTFYENEKSVANNNLTPNQYRKRWDKKFAKRYNKFKKQVSNYCHLTYCYLGSKDDFMDDMFQYLRFIYNNTKENN